MKILVLAPHPFFQARGTPLAVRTVLEFLSARGHQLDVLTFHEGEDVDIPNCRIHRIARPFWIRNIRPGFSIKKVVCDVFMFAKCLRMVRHTQYDLIHAVEESAFIAAAMQRMAGVPYVYDMDSSLAEQMVDAYPGLHFAFSTLRRCEAVAVRHSLGVLTVCAALEDVAHGHAPDKPIGRVEDTTLLPAQEAHSSNGNSAESVLPPGLDGTSPVAMYVGNLEHYQGIGLLLDGFRHALLRVPTAHLVIVGGLRDDIAHYGRRAVQLGISNRVHFLGPKPISALEGLFRRADVLVSPRLKGLNTPMKIYSYLDSGTAVLATRLRTHTQVLDDRTAYLVEPEPQALGDGLAELLTDPALRERLAKQAKAYVQQEFTPEAAHRKLNSFYTMMEARAVGADT
ncbi:MAG TPA: glycosyltransferase family 4 protein [Gemmatimonadales bacterium]|nr:glycosyltransferase family 4 protein [Gemmatimonadales bacterium]